MPLEWAAIAAAVTPHIKKYVTEKTTKLASGYADSKIAKLYRRLMPDQKLEKAVESFVVAFDKELRSSMENPTLTYPAYQDALKVFLADPDVLEALEKPLDAQSELDWEPLKRRWTYLFDSKDQRLIDLPQEFDWDDLAMRYGKSLQKQALADPELRQVAQSLASLRTAAATESAAADLKQLAGPEKHFDLIRYAQSIQEAYSFLRFGSLDSDWTVYEGRISLEHVYVPQSAKPALPPRDLTRDYLKELQGRGASVDPEEMQSLKQQYEGLSAVPVLDVVDDPAYNRLVILGDPGLGKSTLLKYLALRWAHRPAQPLTLLVELRRTVQESGEISFLDYLERGTGQTLPLPRTELDYYLKENESLVLFDALDEVIEGRRDDVVLRIIALAREYPKARIIVTTRIHGYHPGSTYPEQFRDAQFQQYTLQDFEPEEVDRFINIWHKEAFQQPSDRTYYASRLRKALSDSAAIRELSANPLLLTMMAILNRVQALPRDRDKLYERCAELLLKNWDLEKFTELKEKRETKDVKDKLGPEQKMRILELVAAAMQRERTGLAGNIISEERLKQIIEKQLIELGVQQSWSVADDLIWMLRERNFMLAYLGNRQYAFVHRTFLEYFCARDLKYRLEKTTTISLDQLASIFATNWPYEEWQEVLCLLSSMIGVEHATKCISALLSQNQTASSNKALFLAAKCLLEIRQLGSIRDLRTKVQKALWALVDLYPSDRSFEIKLDLLLIRRTAVQALARGWKEEDWTVTWLKELALKDADFLVRSAAIQELAHGWKEEDWMLLWMKQRALEDADSTVRGTAVQELARGWKEEPWMMIWLKELASQQEQNSIVRLTAVQELARGWKEDTELVVWLKEWVLNEQHAITRSIAVRDFASAWKNKAWLVPWLKEIALHPRYASLRWRAIEVLARSGKNDPATLSFLKDRARLDENEDVRLTAIDEMALGWPNDPEVAAFLQQQSPPTSSGDAE